MKQNTPPAPPRETADIVSAINANAALLDRALWSNNISVYAQFKDDRGHGHAFNFDGTLLYQRPLNLRIDLRPAMGDNVMQIGSNTDDYWAWVEPELHAMHWGHHRNSGKPCSGKVSVRPDQLVFALGLSKLPSPEDGLVGPGRKYGKQFDILYYMQPDANYRIAREYWVERTPPYQVRIVNFRDRFGRVVMTAQLQDYRQTWEGGPQAACDVSIGWPLDEGWLRLSIASLSGITNDKVKSGVFDRPAADRLPKSIRANIVQVDEDCDAAVPETQPSIDKP